MNPINVAEGLKELDALAEAEYESGFADAIAVSDRALKMRRIARLSGIGLKRSFAKPHPLTGLSVTGAAQEWNFDESLLTKDENGALRLDSLKGDPTYELELRIYNELQRQGDARFNTRDFGRFLLNNQHESTWFFAALCAAQPYLCGDQKGSENTSQREERQRFWESVKAAADALAKKGLDKALEPVVIGLINLIPFLTGHSPTMFVTGFSAFLVHYAKAGYCSAKFQNEIYITLRLNDYESK